jgi:subtilisin-like proprotein convertase family protein
VNYSGSATSGNISVQGSNSCGNGAVSANFAVTVNAAPTVNAGSDLNVCAGSGVTLNGSATNPVAPVVNTYNGAGLTINASGNSTPYPSTVSVSGLSGTISNIKLNVNNLSHTWPDDIDAVLFGPTGAHSIIFTDAIGGSGGVTARNYTFQIGSTALPLTGLPASGTYGVVNGGSYNGTGTPSAVNSANLNNFVGTNPNGTWSLYFFDDTGGDQGTVGSWSIEITTQPSMTVSWSPATGLSSTTILNPVATPASTTTYTLTSTVNGCSSTDAALVTVDNIPTAVTVSGAGTFCGSAVLTASGGTGGTIYWQNTTPNGTSTANPSSSQTVNASGTYYFRSQSANGCWGPQGSAVVTINTPVIPDVTVNSTNNIFCGISPSAITYTAAQVNGGTTPNYQWFLNGNSVQNGTSNSYVVNSPQNADLVYCVLSSNNSCVSPITDTSSAIITTYFPSTPGNDECATTIPLTVGVATSGSTGCGTASPGMPAVCSGTADDDVWYSFTATETEHLFELLPQGNFDGVIQVFSGTCGALTQMGCIDFFSGPEALYINTLTIGQPYFIRVFSTGNGPAFQGGFTIRVRTKCETLISPTATNSSPVCVGGNVQLTNSDAPTTYSVTNSSGFAIPDLQWVNRVINVTGTGFNANQLSSVLLNLTHTWNSDLNIYLTSPSGITIELSTGNGGSGDNYTNTLFSTTGTSITGGTAPFTGTFQPEQPFSNFTGPADGIWVLRIRDVVGGDAGNFQNVRLNFAATPTYAWTGPNGFTSSSNVHRKCKLSKRLYKFR